MPILNRSVNTRTINKFIKPIQQELLPKLEHFGLSFITSPTTSTMTKVSFSGEDYNKERVVIDFLSNSSHLSSIEDENLSSSVFCNVHYNSGMDSAGIIDLSNIDDSVTKIIHAFNDLGYKNPNEVSSNTTSSDVPTEPVQQEKKKNITLDNTEDDSDNDDSDNDEDSAIAKEKEYQDAIVEFNFKFDAYLKQLRLNDEQNSRMICTMSYSKDYYNNGIVEIDLTYVSNKMCVVQSTGVKPKVEQATTWENAKKYILAISEKIHGVLSVLATDANNVEIELPESNDVDNNDDSNDVDTGINL